MGNLNELLNRKSDLVLGTVFVNAVLSSEYHVRNLSVNTETTALKIKKNWESNG